MRISYFHIIKYNSYTCITFTGRCYICVYLIFILSNTTYVHMIVFDNMQIRYTLNILFSHYQIQSYVHKWVFKVLFHTYTDTSRVGCFCRSHYKFIWASCLVPFHMFIGLFLFLFSYIHRHVTSRF